MSADSLATMSDQLVLAAILLYLVAMIAFALELAFGQVSTRGRARQLVATDGSAVESADPADGPAGEPGDVAPAGWAVKAGPVAVAITWAAWAANLGGTLTRGLAVDRWPWGNMYEFVLAMSLAAVTVFLVLQLKHPVRFLGAFVTVVAAVGLGFAARVLYTQAGPVVPALDSYWVAIHVSAAIAASGLFIVGGVAAVLYLVRGDGESRLPAKADLERVAHRVIVTAFPIWTFAVISGALWADKAWGRYWGWDPKEVWAFITWVAYAAYLHARATAGWKGKAALIISLIAFGCLLFNLIGVNIFFSGLHSYADVPK